MVTFEIHPIMSTHMSLLGLYSYQMLLRVW